MKDNTLVITGDASKLIEELSKAQADFLPVPRHDAGQVGNKTFKYAGYATLMKCVRPALAKYGIAIIQPLHTERDGNGDPWAVTTTILAGHGATIASSLYFAHNENPQEFGRCHTYHRRYQLQGMLAIEGDDDADAAPVNATQFKEAKPPSAPKNEAPKEAPKAPVSADKKPAPAKASTPASPAPASEPFTASSTPLVSGPDPAAKSINVLLEEALKALNWKMADMEAFYKEHVDSAGFKGKPSNMTIDQKRALHTKLVEHHDVVPF